MEPTGTRERIKSLRERLQKSADLESVKGELKGILDGECSELAKAEVG